MDPIFWVVVALALGVVAFGVAILATGRAPRRELQAFPTAANAGKYYLLSGSALLILVVGQLDIWPNDAFSLLAIGVAAALFALAIFRYRPRRASVRHDDSDKSTPS